MAARLSVVKNRTQNTDNLQRPPQSTPQPRKARLGRAPSPESVHKRRGTWWGISDRSGNPSKPRLERGNGKVEIREVWEIIEMQNTRTHTHSPSR